MSLQAEAPTVEELPEGRYSDRELSWLAFNNRVLDLAKDAQRVPLLERAKFLAIFSSNLDEFYMVRVAGLKRRIDAGVAVPSPAGIMPRDLHDAILTRTAELVADQSRVFNEDVRPALENQGIRILDWAELTEDEQHRMHELFTERIFPVLTPLAVDSSHPFPYISGLSINLAVLLNHPTTEGRQFARIKLPSILSRFVPLGSGRFIPLEKLIVEHLDEVFSGMQVLQYTTFRVTRNEDVEVEEDDAENILFALEKELLSRKVGRSPVRLEVEETIDDEMLKLLTSELDISEREVFKIPAPLDLTGLFALTSIDREDLSYPGFLPKTHPDLLMGVESSKPADIFKALRKKDVLVQHPYDSFATSVQRLVEQAAADPRVLAIKQTLYRTSGDSPIIDALIEAAMAGKQVLALVEIKARFDEQANIAWARKLEKYGVHVVYGMVGLKTHCKLMLVVRDDPDGLRRYAHIGTGNYNPKTARLYEDVGLLTASPEIGADLTDLFNSLTGYSRKVSYRNLLVAPHGIRRGILERIDREIEAHRQHGHGRIRIKANAIVDEQIIDGLYRASQAGVRVEVVVRGICALRPGVDGFSENIAVRSILGQFLEHSRVMHFQGIDEFWIGSADMMHRNLDRRVEVMAQVKDRRLTEQLDEMFDSAMHPATRCWELGSDGSWTAAPRDGREVRDHQVWLMEKHRQG